MYLLFIGNFFDQTFHVVECGRDQKSRATLKIHCCASWLRTTVYVK